MKNYLHIILLSLLIILCTVYFINSRKIIIEKADEVLKSYEEMNSEMNNNLRELELYQELNSQLTPEEYIGPTETDEITEDADKTTSSQNTDILDGYYITILDNMVVVTTGDKETVLEHTGITAEGLDITEIDELREGIYVKDMNYVFSILESFSS